MKTCHMIDLSEARLSSRHFSTKTGSGRRTGSEGFRHFRELIFGVVIVQWGCVQDLLTVCEKLFLILC